MSKTDYNLLIQKAIMDLNDRGADPIKVPKPERDRAYRIEKAMEIMIKNDDKKRFMQLLKDWFTIWISSVKRGDAT